MQDVFVEIPDENHDAQPLLKSFDPAKLKYNFMLKFRSLAKIRAVDVNNIVINIIGYVNIFFKHFF